MITDHLYFENNKRSFLEGKNPTGNAKALKYLDYGHFPEEKISREEVDTMDFLEELTVFFFFLSGVGSL